METELDLAAQIVAGVLKQEPLEVSQVVGKGLVNLIFIARSVTGNIVVRLSKPEDSGRALASYEKEAWCLNKAVTLGIPGPAVLAVGSWMGRPYMLQTHILGTNGEDLPSQRSTIWLALGRYARRIHSVRLSGFGETPASFYASNAAAEWERFVSYNIDSLTQDDELIRLDVYGPEQADLIRERFSALLTRQFTFGLNHGDLSPRNTVVAENGEVNLLDWGSAEAHIVPHYDFRYWLLESNPVGPDMQSFLEGYGMDETDYGRLLPELRAFKLLKAFDLTRWAIARCPEVISEKVTWAKLALQELLTEI